ncbi:hypothetical protein GCM10029992_56300 [Glycomyces albus]
MPSPFSRIRRGDLIAAALLYAAGAGLIGLGSFEPYWSDAPLALRFAPRRWCAWAWCSVAPRPDCA